MGIRINGNESKKVKIFKLCYLIPYIFIAYVPCVIYFGVKEMGNPFSGMKEIIKEILK